MNRLAIFRNDTMVLHAQRELLAFEQWASNKLADIRSHRIADRKHTQSTLFAQYVWFRSRASILATSLASPLLVKHLCISVGRCVDPLRTRTRRVNKHQYSFYLFLFSARTPCHRRSRCKNIYSKKISRPPSPFERKRKIFTCFTHSTSINIPECLGAVVCRQQSETTKKKYISVDRVFSFRNGSKTNRKCLCKNPKPNFSGLRRVGLNYRDFVESLDFTYLSCVCCVLKERHAER